ncbi:hypothetical protein [Streptomyces regalis]|uniref:Secreted protein n=1 Tax=Streptomyces regalis TaxID=68262 RepID=A0A101JHV7_9ACTN|nr:hypothetical protein [Streptomyces regalis]KUL27200.1 hypothetical protein ADL12_30505 [Streptomyces regalis]
MRPTPARLATVAAAVLVGVLAPVAAAAPAPALPLPVPAAGAESLVTEGVTIEGPLVNNLTLPMLK